MKHCESDVERQISIQGIHLSALWNYFWKREGSFKYQDCPIVERIMTMLIKHLNHVKDINR